jgi:membrane protease YdiL (CAAX protease family)
MNKITKEDLGFTKWSLRTLGAWILCTVLMIISTYLIKLLVSTSTFLGTTKTIEESIAMLPMYCIGAYFQEFIFRGYVFARAKKLYGTNLSILITIFLFTILHIPLLIQYNSLILLYSLLGGVLWTLLYAKYQNIILAGTSHAIVGALTTVLLRRY